MRGLSRMSLLLVALASFGGPLALAGLYAPQAVDEVTSAAGWIVISGVAAFAALLALWLRFGREVAGPGGLSAFVEEALGEGAALAHAGVWTASYALYLVYTSVYVVYDLLPVAWSGLHGARPWLALALPVAVALLLLAGRTPVVFVVGVIAVVQLVLLLVADLVGLVHASGAAATTGHAHDGVAAAVLAVGSLFVCGSLPLFLGGDLLRPKRELPRALGVAFGVTAVLTLLAVYPYAQHPAYTHGAIPAMTVVDNESAHWLAVAVGLGVAASVVGVMLVEGLALTRLVHAATGRSTQTVARVLAVALVVAAPFTVANPDRFYGDLLRPSLVLLWVAQLVVVVAFAVFAVRRRLHLAWLPVTAVAAVLTGWALVTSARGNVGT